MKNWMYDGSSKVEPIISSRIRIARNIKNKSFPHHLTKEEAHQLIKMVEDAFYTSEHIKDKYKTFKLWEEDKNKLKSYLEKHLISPNLLRTPENSAFILNKEETIAS